MKLWSGRFSKNTSHLMDDFHSSIGFDQRLEGTDLVVEGTFDTYNEGGLTYCHLRDAEVSFT